MHIILPFNFVYIHFIKDAMHDNIMNEYKSRKINLYPIVSFKQREMK